MPDYIINSERLGFRNWTNEDLPALAKINADHRVMRYFASTLSEMQTQEFIVRMQRKYHEKGYCYFAVDLLEDGHLIGMIGLSDKTFKATFTPCVDIGWRIGFDDWNKGYATEGARVCLNYGHHHLKIPTIYSLASKGNTQSEKVMIKIGMKKVGEFDHPELTKHPDIQGCVLYTSMPNALEG